MTIRRPAVVSPPGELLREELEERGWTQDDLADILGRSVSLVNEIITGKRGITPETALALAAVFDMSAEFWMNREARYQLWRTGEDATANSISRKAKIYGKGPLKEMFRRGWLEPSTNVDVLEQQVIAFYELLTIDDEPQFQSYAARRTRQNEPDTPAQRAWLFRAKKLAHTQYVMPYSPSNLDRVIEELRPLLYSPEAARHVPRILGEAGIRFLVVEPLRGTRIDGACFWLSPTAPVLVLSMRFDRIDNFWHTLMHELGHLKDNEAALDLDLLERSTDEGAKSEAELSADRFAVEHLVPPQELEGFINRIGPLYSRGRINAFATRIHVHPGIVVGQLQHRREIVWSSFRALLAPIREAVTSSALTDGWGERPPAIV